MNETQADFDARCKRLGITKKTAGEILAEVSDFRMLVHDAFNRHSPINYREAAIDRAIKLGVSIQSDCNTTFNLAIRFVRVLCPSCGEHMVGSGSGGNSEVMCVSYNCKCGVSAGLTFPCDGGLSFQFKGK